MKRSVTIPRPFLIYVLLLALICFLLSAGSCAFTSEGLTMLTGDYTSPTLEHFTLENERKAIITFSREVSFPRLEYYVLEENQEKNTENTEGTSLTNEKAVFIDNVISEKKVNTIASAIGEDSYIAYELLFPYDMGANLQYILSGTVKDEIGSTLSFSLSFSGYNSRVPHMIFSEISTEYSKPRTEFVELYVLEDGNLAGVILQSANDGIEKDFVFPSVEVKKGEYIVLHMRTVEEGAVNELDENIALSNTKQSSTEGRDLWIAGTETRFSKNDVLLLRKRHNGALLDAVSYTDGLKSEWPKDIMRTYVQEAFNEGIWEGVETAYAINIEYITGTRTLNRQNIDAIKTLFEEGKRVFPNSKNDWLIVATSNLSPGKENSENPYVKK